MELECCDIVCIKASAELCINPQTDGSKIADALTELVQPPLDVHVFELLVFFQAPLSLSNALKFAQDSRRPIFDGVSVVVKEVVDVVKFDANQCQKGLLSSDLLCGLRKEAICLVEGGDDVENLVAKTSNLQYND